MAVKSINLIYVAVSDMEKAKKFFVDTLGLTLNSETKEFGGWLELQGEDGGTMLGVGPAHEDMKVGTNAVVTLDVDDIIKTKANLESKGVTFLGDIMEVPGHVKLALFTDPSGNKFQLVETISPKK